MGLSPGGLPKLTCGILLFVPDVLVVDVDVDGVSMMTSMVESEMIG